MFKGCFSSLFCECDLLVTQVGIHNLPSPVTLSVPSQQHIVDCITEVDNNQSKWALGEDMARATAGDLAGAVDMDLADFQDTHASNLSSLPSMHYFG